MGFKMRNTSGESIRPLNDRMEESVMMIMEHINKTLMKKMLDGVKFGQISSKEEQTKMQGIVTRFIENVQFVSKRITYPEEIAKALINNDNKNLEYIMNFWVDKKGIILKKLDGPIVKGGVNQDAEDFKFGLKGFLDSINK
ncbi:MAG: hypothetical protein NUV37_01220 [Nanoarchaeota archaeon]|nr:hypothetical protein [Nanoarchaeota archaeon]